ncbi:hypothetical protein [Agrococcus sp. ARC_14]|uniref:hypothetical protein n=1 Tax=Agrococcus sp. ARC_14 TaxID=2919927 RepID=UPI001F0598FA|nr:hypothetical protein [Agrococcus sp. ARC_14]MCH1882708.1 hypothetical protein [Agrococcus sp. ARC_14]
MVERTSAQRRWIIIAAAALLIVVGIVWAAVAAGGGATPTAPTDSASAAPSVDPSADPSATSAPPATPAATPPPAATTAAPPASDAPIAPEAEPVAPTEVAEQEVSDGETVRVELAQIEQVDGQAIAPGEIAGPAVRLTIEVSNATSEPLNAGLIVVNAYFGDARRPGNSLMQPGGSPFGGSIAPGESAAGVYLFEAGDAELADVLVGVDVVPGQPTFTFRGDLR